MHTLIDLTEKIGKALHQGNSGCAVSVDLQKVLDVVEHQILLAKLDPYGIRGVSSDWFKSYLSNRNQLMTLVLLP